MRALLVVAGFAMLSSCALRSSETTTTTTTATSTSPTEAAAPREQAVSCNPLGVTACGLPFPSDLFTARDASSPTGRVVEVRDDLVSDGYRSQVPASMSPSAVFDGASGFSASTPVLFELDAPPDPATLPADGGDAFVVFDTSSGERVPIRAEIDAEAAGTAQPSAVLRAWPAVRFEHSHHYVAALTAALRRQDGSAYSPSAGFAKVLDGGDPDLASYLAPSLELLSEEGIEGGALLAVTEFTVRAEEEVQAEVLEPVSKAAEQAHPVVIDSVAPAEKPAGAMTVQGSVELTNFQDPVDGSFDGSAEGRPYSTAFQLVVPASAAGSPAPVAIYGHGYGGDRTKMIEFLRENDGAGVATIAIDWSNRGTRSEVDGGYVVTLDDPSEQARFASTMPQGIVDVESLRSAVETSLADLDVQPPGGDGVPDLDPEHVIYEGTSYGGILGVSVLGAVEGIEGGILHVCGIGLMDSLVKVPVWPAQRGVIPQDGPGTDAAIAVALLQHSVDASDGSNWAHTYREPLDGGPPRPVLLQYGEGDTWVRNVSSEALIDAAGLPEVVQPIPQGASPFVDGFGWQLMSNDGSIAEEDWGMYAHAFSTTMPAAREVTAAWLAEYRSAPPS